MMLTKRSQIESLGVKFIEVSKATEVAPGVCATGPIERKFNKENFPKFFKIDSKDEAREVDWIPDSQGLVIKTSEGPIVLSDCGHSSTVNLVAQVTNTIQRGPVLGLMGGLHLFNASESTRSWTGLKLKETGISYLMAGHCTGVAPMFSLKEALGLSRSSAVIGAVGAKFTTRKG